MMIDEHKGNGNKMVFIPIIVGLDQISNKKTIYVVEQNVEHLSIMKYCILALRVARLDS